MSPITGVDKSLSDAAGGSASLGARDASPLGFAGGLDLAAVARGSLGFAVGGEALSVAAEGAARCSVDGGASESGGADGVWPLALPYDQTQAHRKPRARSVARFIGVLQMTLVDQIDCAAPGATLCKN
ncbi:hypothetical protein JQ615_24460 [Bradyrhizobium jicamae]|uniref:Uncharacterized protein n=1 Tax=Bradyrhizobium jicamae TaxID=280332 RepID=A0ABS5FP16_9BRAD|nr:hypothetical protein [Bradyrhizobium jicamae]MBR0798546.1 hypothetical protein [Bradyrhizobium jicamae]MBR0937182.1 hypothetical protein [Bradyrhizobium jicamae]